MSKCRQENKLIHRIRASLTIPLILMIGGCDGVSDFNLPSDPPDNARHDCNSCNILFIGSSYLSFIGNDVVETFNQFAVEAGKDVHVEMRAIGGWHLADHSQNEGTIAIINEREWDHIILQGNAAYLSKEKWHQYIVPYIIDLRKIIKNRSKRTCVIYMMPWAYKDGLAWLPDETDTYEQMQENLYHETIKLVNDIDIATAPVGWVWYTAFLDNYEADLYLNDFNHQSKSGAYLAACVIYSTVFLEKAPMITYDWDADNDPPYLHDLSYSIVLDSLELWNIY